MKIKLAVAALAAASLFAGAAAADVETYKIDSRHTFPVFEVNHLGFSMQRGRFDKTEGAIKLDRAKKAGEVEVTIHANSINMGLEDWNKHMRAEDFFNVEKYPHMTFKSKKVLFDGDKVVGAEGEFTMLGVTKPMIVTISDFRCGEHPRLKKMMCGGNVVGTLKRSEFGMKYGLGGIGDDIKISTPIEAFKE